MGSSASKPVAPAGNFQVTVHYNGQTVSITVTGSTTVAQLRGQVPGAKATDYLTMNRRVVNDTDTMADLGASGTTNFVYRDKASPLALDIGVWGAHPTAPLTRLLMAGGGSGTREEYVGGEVRAAVRTLTTDKFGAQPELVPAAGAGSACKSAGWYLASDEEVLTPLQRRALVALTDAIEARGDVACRDEAGPEEDAESDFKTTLSLADLTRTLDPTTIDGLKRAFGGRVDMVKLRRVRARPAGEEYCINFHLDHAQRTLSVALNDPSEYEGGRIVYLAADGQVHTPVRRPGTALVHDNTCVHGVTKLTRGTRYHLFLLQHGK